MIILCASFICVLRVEQSRSSLGLESQGKIQHNPPRKCVTRLSKYFAFRELARTAIELTARRCEKGQALEYFSSKFQLAGLATSVCLQGNWFIFQYFNNLQDILNYSDPRWESLHIIPSINQSKGIFETSNGVLELNAARHWKGTVGRAFARDWSSTLPTQHTTLRCLHSTLLHSQFQFNSTYSTLCIPPPLHTPQSLQWLGRICKTVIT